MDFFKNFQGMSEMAKAISDSILGVIRKFELMLTRCAVNMLGGGLRSPSAFLVLNKLLKLLPNFLEKYYL